MTDEQFRDIAPYGADEFVPNMRLLVDEPGFEHAVKFVLPDVDYARMRANLLGVGTTEQLQHLVMLPFLERLAHAVTTGVSCSGMENLDPGRAGVFITNHRDIVLDASFLNMCFGRHNLPTTEIALGDNLLIYDWIERLVKLNKGLIVKRNLRMSKALEAARQLSAYIHYCISDKHQSVWIAQREGRAKDSNDRTQESLIKMLALHCPNGETLTQSLMSLNLTPTAIAYEYDPTDFLKVREFVNKRRDPDFKKCPHDDLVSMETGILGRHGDVHFGIAQCINEKLATACEGITDRNEILRLTCEIIDNSIYLNYRIYPVNYIAYDRLSGENRFASKYDADDVVKFENYIDAQLAKVGIEDITADEREYMMRMMLTMYANPLKNQLTAREQCVI